MPRALRQRHEPWLRTDDTTCRFCQKVYKRAGSLENHLQTRHPQEYAARNKQIDDPSTRLPTPPPPDEPPVDPYGVEWRMLTLYPNLNRPETRIRTTIRIEEFEYDSDGQDDDDDHEENGTNSGENANLDSTSGKAKKAPRYPSERYPQDPIEVGYDGTNREGTLRAESRWHPFRNGFEFRLARYILDNNFHQKAIDDLFNLDLARDPPRDADGMEGVCFTSAYTYEKMLHNMNEELSMKAWTRGTVWHHGVGLIEFRYRLLEIYGVHAGEGV
ncbi:hypothetical protein BJ508DRAFT_316345 [Ascobolus immersus RN42]|uniref:C2H2-type domain-containing protein n=1 Tax=Ascobolus immersus RN42 TaxID=1160509 RepID=A0A3N4HLU1_ASCIM|nr:hypothetical protein BJ508DRAFT_316345 [Ascobolus immersus RN42]